MEEKYPELKDRVQSTFIDTLFIIIIMFVLASILEKFENVPDSIIIVLFVGLFFLYEPICLSLGCTLGNYLKGIRVRKFEDRRQRINIAQALLRYPIKLFLGWISFLTIHSNAGRRAIHDLASGSVMIKL